MTVFTPPIAERETSELVVIANCSDENVWQLEATRQAKKELVKRGVTEKEQLLFLEEIKLKEIENDRLEAERLEKNKTESYTKGEMFLIFLLGPFIFFNIIGFSSHHTLFTLRGEQFYLKFKQRIIIFILSFLAWSLYAYYTANQHQKEKLEEIENIDISDWKKTHGYD